jgi:hypothetical protein
VLFEGLDFQSTHYPLIKHASVYQIYGFTSHILFQPRRLEYLFCRLPVCPDAKFTFIADCCRSRGMLDEEEGRDNISLYLQIRIT